MTDLVHGGEAGRWGGWEWRKPRRGDHFRTCSYCGSIHPEDLAAEIVPQGKCSGCDATGWEAHFRLHAEPEHHYDPGGPYASWADRKYGWPHKFYVENLRPRDREMLHVFTHCSGERAPEGYAYPYIAAADLTDEQKQIIESDGMGPRGEDYSGWYAFKPKAALFAKFYTQHLAAPGIPAEAREKIEAACGIRFHFADGTVAWHSPAVPCEEAHGDTFQF